VNFLKLALTCPSDPTGPARRDADPNRPTYGSKERGYDLGGFVQDGQSAVGSCR